MPTDKVNFGLAGNRLPTVAADDQHRFSENQHFSLMMKRFSQIFRDSWLLADFDRLEFLDTLAFQATNALWPGQVRALQPGREAGVRGRSGLHDEGSGRAAGELLVRLSTGCRKVTAYIKPEHVSWSSLYDEERFARCMLRPIPAFHPTCGWVVSSLFMSILHTYRYPEAQTNNSGNKIM